jgi:hypothetical protein
MKTQPTQSKQLTVEALLPCANCGDELQGINWEPVAVRNGRRMVQRGVCMRCIAASYPDEEKRHVYS